MALEQDLKQLGFNEKEARIYLAALELGPSSVQNIAKKSKVKRATIYEIINNLKKKGIFDETVKGKKRLFIASGPENIKSILLNQERLFEKILPELKSFSGLETAKPKIKFYENVEEIKKAYEDIIVSKPEEVLSISSVSSIADLLGWDWGNNYITERVSKKIPVRVITNYFEGVEEFMKRDEKELRKIKILPKDKQFVIDIEIYNNKVLFLSLKKEMMALLIESKTISDSMKMFFEIMWQCV